MHPDLEWEEIAVTTVAVLEDCGLESSFQVRFDLENVPGFGSEELRLLVDRVGIPAERRREYGEHMSPPGASNWPPLLWPGLDFIMEEVMNSRCSRTR